MDFRLKSVLNTDSYDRRKYGELREISKKLQEAEQAGSSELPTFPHLLGDTWAGLFKNQPQVTHKVPGGVQLHKPLMVKLLGHPEFQGFREYTRLDELASALGTVQLADRLKKLVQENNQVTEKARAAGQKRQEAEGLRDRAEALKDAAQLLQGNPEKKQEMQKEARSLASKATRQVKQAGQLEQQAAEMLAAHLESSRGQEDLARVVQEATRDTREQVGAVEDLLSGLGYGAGPGQQQDMPVRERIALAEEVQRNAKLKKIANLAGRMKRIAAKKQKTRSTYSVVNTRVSYGNDPARFLPGELMQLKHPATRQDFLRRFAEGQVLQYAPRAREKLGKGPIVVCLDTSGSMRHRDEEAKAVMLALLAIAKKQNRAFAVVNFASAGQCRTWEFPHSRKITPSQVVELAQFFWDGGTNFQVPLDSAVQVIKGNKFKLADIVFITDGRCSLDEQWLQGFLGEKRVKRFSMIAVQLGTGETNTLKRVADEVVAADTLFSEKVTDVVLTV